MAINKNELLTERIRGILSYLYTNICLFSLVVLKKHFVKKPAKFHIQIYNLLLSKRKREKCIVAPRGHSKSTVVSLCYVLWCALFRQKRFIVIVSDTYTKACFFIAAIKDEIENNPVIKLLFGDVKGDRWREDDIELTIGCKIVGVGTEQDIRGYKYNQFRPDLIILDDCESDEIVSNPELRKKVMSWLYKEVMPALDPHIGELCVIGTILHWDSMLMNLYKNPNFESLFFMATADGTMDSEPLWKEQFPIEKLRKIKSTYEEAGLLDLFMTEYMNTPVNKENAPFKEEMIKTCDSGIDISAMSITIAVDLAISKKERADYSVIFVLGSDLQNSQYAIDYFRGKTDPLELAEQLYMFCLKYQPAVVGIETTAYQKAFQYTFEEVMKSNNQYFNVEEIKQDMDKERRIITILQPRFKSGNFFVKEWMTELKEELLSFPKGKHDDIIDAATMAVMLSQPSFGVQNNMQPDNAPAMQHRRGFYRKTQVKTLADYR